jgi:hypothetical protein
MDTPSQKPTQEVPDRQIIGNVDGTSYNDAEACTRENENLTLDEGNEANARPDANKRNKYLTFVAVLTVGALLASFISFDKAPNGDVEHAKAPRSNPINRRMEHTTNHSLNIEDLLNIAKQSKPTSDKFTDHTYQTMYGTFLMPLRDLTYVKMLEIGMGCNMKYGPGASVKLWRTILPQAELWEAEYNKECVDEMRTSGTMPKDLNVLVGDQKDPKTLQSWIKESGGMFDVVIDDGAHSNRAIKTSFDYLWPHVKPGGVYFIEDLQVGRSSQETISVHHYAFDDTNGAAVMSDIIQTWIEQLLIDPHIGVQPKKDLVAKHPLPKAVEGIFCQYEACVLMKQSRDHPGKQRR